MSQPIQPSESERREEGINRRQSVVDRRVGLDRRTPAGSVEYSGVERRSGDRRQEGATGLERRRGPGRRLSDLRRQAEEGEMTPEQFEFVMAIELYKKLNKRLYPTWTEVLEVITQLGYRKVSPRQVNLTNVPEPALTQI